ncbi:MAG: lytic murein transglycosylase [Pseudomonadota bacterium]
MRILGPLFVCLWSSAAVASVPCGGSFSGFASQMRDEAVRRGHASQSVERFFQSVRQDPKVIERDRAQGVFKMAFLDFSRRVISQNRLDRGRSNAQRHGAILERAEAQYGVPAGVLLAFWALETDYGAVQGDFNTLNALMTLSHDCRRPDLFRPQVFAALELFEQGAFDPATTTGAWAGEVGMVQMLPEDIIENGIDGDGDGVVSLKTSVPDALLSGAKMLQSLGWQAGEPWLQEVTVPASLNWAETGLQSRKTVADWAALGVEARNGALGSSTLQAALLLPQGRKGPAFLAYPNFDVYFEWNQSFVYVTTAAYFATRLSGAQIYRAGEPDPALPDAQMKALQEKLQARGHDVGKIDGILGAKTRAAVQAEQRRLGLPADAWPTRQLLDAL